MWSIFVSAVIIMKGKIMDIFNRLDKKEAIDYLGLDAKTFENYFRFAGEFSCLPRAGGKGKFYFDKAHLEEWRASYQWRTIELTIDDYALCLDFALAQHFRGYVLRSDVNNGHQTFHAASSPA